MRSGEGGIRNAEPGGRVDDGALQSMSLLLAAFRIPHSLFVTVPIPGQ